MKHFPADTQAFRFMPLSKFRWYREIDGHNRLIGEYHPGMTYNCTTNPVHDALREQCKQWADEGKISIIPLAPGQSLRMVKPSELNLDDPAQE